MGRFEDGMRIIERRYPMLIENCEPQNSFDWSRYKKKMQRNISFPQIWNLACQFDAKALRELEETPVYDHVWFEEVPDFWFWSVRCRFGQAVAGVKSLYPKGYYWDYECYLNHCMVSPRSDHGIVAAGQFFSNYMRHCDALEKRLLIEERIRWERYLFLCLLQHNIHDRKYVEITENPLLYLLIQTEPC